MVGNLPMLDVLRSPAFNLVVSAIAAAAATALSYLWLGFLGVALVGLLIGFVAVQVDLGRETVRGFEARQRMSRSERAAHRAELDALSAGTTAAKRLGLVLALIGGIGFFLLQLPP